VIKTKSVKHNPNLAMMATHNNDENITRFTASFSKADKSIRPSEWNLPNAIDIDDADITFDGQPLSALFEEVRHSFEDQTRENSKCSQRGRKISRE